MGSGWDRHWQLLEQNISLATLAFCLQCYTYYLTALRPEIWVDSVSVLSLKVKSKVLVDLGSSLTSAGVSVGGPGAHLNISWSQSVDGSGVLLNISWN